MRLLDLRTVRLVAAKELLESLRDKRTLFVALVLPVLLYPLVTLGILSVVSSQTKRLAESEQPMALTGSGADAVRRIVLEPPPAPPPTPPPGPADLETAPPARPALRVVESGDPRADLAAGRIALWVEADAGLEEALLRGETASVRARYDGSDDRSLAAFGKWKEAFQAASSRELAARLQRNGLPREWTQPLACDIENLAPPERTSAWAFGKILPMLLVLMTLTSSFYPAVDAVAGEKERGTMETLLVAPCGRIELVLGKFLAVLAVTIASGVLNLASLALTAGPALSAVGGSRLPPLQITFGTIAGILVLLLPLAALFSAISVSVSTLARSIKEAQHYLTPIVVLVMPLALVVVLPNLPLTPTLAAVPVTNAVLFFRDLMVGRTEWGTTALVFGTTFAAAGLALWASVSLFLQEQTLFRGPEGTAVLSRPAPRETPTAGSAVFLFAASLATLWYAKERLPQGLVGNVLVTQLAIVLAPCLLLAVWFRLRPAATFRLALPRRAAVGLGPAVAIGLALPVVNFALNRVLFGAPDPTGPLRDLQEKLEAVLRTTPATTLVLALAVLPAVCEEAVYRGYVLAGFGRRADGRPAWVRGVVVSAALFALSHVFPEKWVATFPVGLVLGWIAVRTGSLFPGILVHALNNGFVVLAAKLGPETDLRVLWDADHPQYALAVAANAAVLVVAFAALWFVTRRAPAQGVRGT